MTTTETIQQTASRSARDLSDYLAYRVDLLPHHIPDLQMLLDIVNSQVQAAIAECESRLDEQISSESSSPRD